jgi:hypothetical protein
VCVYIDSQHCRAPSLSVAAHLGQPCESSAAYVVLVGAVACATVSDDVISLIAHRFGHPSPEMLMLAQVPYPTHRGSIVFICRAAGSDPQGFGLFVVEQKSGPKERPTNHPYSARVYDYSAAI